MFSILIQISLSLSTAVYISSVKPPDEIKSQPIVTTPMTNNDNSIESIESSPLGSLHRTQFIKLDASECGDLSTVPTIPWNEIKLDTIDPTIYLFQIFIPDFDRVQSVEAINLGREASLSLPIIQRATESQGNTMVEMDQQIFDFIACDDLLIKLQTENRNYCIKLGFQKPCVVITGNAGDPSEPSGHRRRIDENTLMLQSNENSAETASVGGGCSLQASEFNSTSLTPLLVLVAMAFALRLYSRSRIKGKSRSSN